MLEVAEVIRLPVGLTHLVEDVQSVQDPVTLKAFCVDLAKGIKAEREREEKSFQRFASFSRRIAKWALGLSAVFAIVLLAAWLAVGQAARELRKPKVPA